MNFFGDAKATVKLGIGVIEMKVADLFEDVFRVCDTKEGTGEVTMPFTGVFKKFRGDDYVKDCNLSFCVISNEVRAQIAVFLLPFFSLIMRVLILS